MRRVIIEDDEPPHPYGPTIGEEGELRSRASEYGVGDEDNDDLDRSIEDVVAEYDEDQDEFGDEFWRCHEELVDLGLSSDEATARLGRRTRELPSAAPAPSSDSRRRAGHASPRPRARTTGPQFAIGTGGELVALDEADGPDVVVHPDARGHEDRSDEDSTRWLRDNDPQLTAEGVAAGVQDALTDAGLTRDHVALAFKRGKPTRNSRELRERLRAALTPMWEDGRRRDFMAEELGYNRRNIERLMQPPP